MSRQNISRAIESYKSKSMVKESGAWGTCDFIIKKPVIVPGIVGEVRTMALISKMSPFPGERVSKGRVNNLLENLLISYMLLPYLSIPNWCTT